jgi:thiol-disulfide isomerase/thioredoxin
VPRGKYELAVNLYGTTEGCLVHPVAQRVVQIEVADAQNPLDLGKLVIPSQDVPQVGDQAMNFKFETPEGKTTDLAAQRGKYVLLDFWATWCGPCVANLPVVEALRNEFGESKALVVVGANLDSEPEAAREFLRKKPLPWHHALLGDWSSTDVPKRYGISSVPAYVLVDPDGRIAALEYSADDVRKRLQVLADHR